MPVSALGPSEVDARSDVAPPSAQLDPLESIRDEANSAEMQFRRISEWKSLVALLAVILGLTLVIWNAARTLTQPPRHPPVIQTRLFDAFVVNDKLIPHRRIESETFLYCGTKSPECQKSTLSVILSGALLEEAALGSDPITIKAVGRVDKKSSLNTYRAQIPVGSTPYLHMFLSCSTGTKITVETMLKTPMGNEFSSATKVCP